MLSNHKKRTNFFKVNGNSMMHIFNLETKHKINSYILVKKKSVLNNHSLMGIIMIIIIIIFIKQNVIFYNISEFHEK